MTENYTDCDLEYSIRTVVARLQISGCSAPGGKPLKELFAVIETRCPDAATLLLERTFEKDKLRDYLARSPPFSRTAIGDIDGTGDPTFESHWRKLAELSETSGQDPSGAYCTYLQMHAAQIAARQFRDPQDRKRFVTRVRSALADAVARGEPPAARAVERKSRDASA